ncbi:stage III sporulation protein AG [Paenibacillus mendelii]|uniref:Stage III sporulation protein AG n=1 Tax=Paenibacillus mendelii TaxID=206163 RepID=A0ABV6JHA0_9BACL|nr:stage III sporulation protein AG [Paenibacillus mendelii]MCQ6558157.1 stage III sporulation protein AG [Paenibacillus mendelii]
MAKWLEGLEKLVGGGPGGPKRVKTLRWLLLVGALGVALMLLNSLLTFQTVEPTTEQPAAAPSDQTTFLGGKEGEGSSFEAIEHPLENRLKDILEKIVGVGSVTVLVTVDSTEEIIVGRNDKETQQITDENDKNGGKRHITSTTKDGQVVLYESSGGQSPLITKRIKPKIRGVLIVAKGAENGTVRRLVLDAVEKGLNVPVNRIAVVPSKHAS